ncbi:DUF2141 domain-containing protein [Caulobacter sp. NIBR1757]|uniref:DUF2141 domain-containing protein n=1 Tax=Caulobacter sp. NIBR1757 TaxID=3016000 RepID=UPI0022F0F721|nr:DUF2141 domain-containing protein [Caulobacter sp. NIBR1757]WGM41043.1 hypothetical protein AMEJIAPC_03991 [Caulobacter sp. NIBR1757]
MFSPSAKAALAASLLTAIAVVNAPRAQAQEAGEVSVTFSGITAPRGALFVGLYDNEAAFAGGNPVGGYRLEVNGATVGQSIKGLKPGRYALKVYHDIDGDGRMNTNAFGIPTEPYSASNNAPSTMGPPAWADAVFEVGANGATQSITID